MFRPPNLFGLLQGDNQNQNHQRNIWLMILIIILKNFRQVRWTKHWSYLNFNRSDNFIYVEYFYSYINTKRAMCLYSSYYIISSLCIVIFVQFCFLLFSFFLFFHLTSSNIISPVLLHSLIWLERKKTVILIIFHYYLITMTNNIDLCQYSIHCITYLNEDLFTFNFLYFILRDDQHAHCLCLILYFVCVWVFVCGHAFVRTY